MTVGLRVSLNAAVASIALSIVPVAVPRSLLSRPSLRHKVSMQETSKVACREQAPGFADTDFLIQTDIVLLSFVSGSLDINFKK